MASANNIPKDIQGSIRAVLDHRIKISIKRLVKQEVRADKTENRVLAFSPCRLFVLAAKVPSKVEHSFHFLDIQALESKKVNQLALTIEGKVYTFTTLDPNTEEINHMITHIGISLKQIFPAFPLERLIVKLEVTPPDRLRTMNDMIRGVESRDVGPCGGFTTQYACMCDYHGLPYREEVAWDVDTIYLSQDSRELCLRDFDHLSGKDTVPIIGALEHNTWFTTLNVGNVKLTPEACSEILKVMKRNAILEHLNLSNTGIKTDFLQKLSTALLSNSGTQLSYLDISGNFVEDRGVMHLMGTLKSLARGLSHLDLSRTGITSRCVNKVADTISQSQTLLASLQTLKVAENGQKGEDVASMYLCLAQPTVLTTLDLSATDCALDSLVGPLLMGCPHLSTLSLSRTTFTHKRTKDAVIPLAWKQFFASTCSLQFMDLSATRLPCDAVKELLLGIASNRHLKNLDLDLSSNELGSQGAQIIAGCISNIQCLGRLDISNNNFDGDLKTLVLEIAKNRHLKHLAIGRNFSSIKPKHMWSVLETVVQLIQEEDTVLESLSLADSKLKQDTACIINALGSNNSLTFIDLSGNGMGDYGARMLSKALQINSKLHTVVWDKNGVTAQGFEDIADALAKNYTLKRMPFPVNDAASAMRTQAERTETALQKVEQLLQRNHSPRKFASDQMYRLQQGFLISSTQQMVDRLCVQVQDAVNALKVGNSAASQDDLGQAEKVIRDADNSKQLLPKLQKIAMQTQDTGNAVETSLRDMADKLHSIMEETMRKSVEDMLHCTATHCEGVMSDKAFRNEVETGCKSRSSLPKDFAKLVLDSITTDVYNKLSELNLAVAAYISDSVIDEVIDKLSDNHKGLANHLNLRKSSQIRDSTVSRDQPEKGDTEKEEEKGSEAMECRTRQPSGPFYMRQSDVLFEDKNVRTGLQSIMMGLMGSPKLSSKRKSVFSRKLRPQSVIDRTVFAGGDVVGESSPIKEEEATVGGLTAPGEHADDLEEMGSKPSSVQNKAKETSSKGSSESLDKLTELPQLQVQKLEHLNKDRPKRAKTRAATRPVAPSFSTTDKTSEDGVDIFYMPKAGSADAEPGEKTKDHSKGQGSSGRKLSVEDGTTAKPEKKKWSPMSWSKDKVEKKEEKEKEKKEEKKGPSFSSGISNFFRNKGSKADSKDKDKDKKHESILREKSTNAPLPVRSETSKVYTKDAFRNSQAESPKSQRPESNLSMASPPTITVDAKVLAESPKILAPRASEESLDDDEPTKADAKTTDGKTKAGEEMEQSNGGKEEKRSKSSKSSTPEVVEEEGESGASAAAESQGHAVLSVSEEKGEQEEKAEEPSPASHVPKGLPRMGFGANVIADLKAQKRFSTRLPSPEPKDAKDSFPAKKTEQVEPAKKTERVEPAKKTERVEPAKKTERVEKEAKKEETNNNEVSEKEEQEKKEKPAAKPEETIAPKTALLPPTKTSPSPRPAPRAVVPPKRPSSNTIAGSDSAESAPSAPTPKPRPTPPAKPKPPVTAPKPRPSVKLESPPKEDSATGSGEAASTAETKAAEGEIVYDSTTLRLSVKDKIKRLSQVKFEPPSSSAAQKKAASLPRDARLPDSVPEGEENSHDSSATSPSTAEIDEEVDGGSSMENSVDEHKQKAARKTGEDEIMV